MLGRSEWLVTKYLNASWTTRDDLFGTDSVWDDRRCMFSDCRGLCDNQDVTELWTERRVFKVFSSNLEHTQTSDHLPRLLKIHPHRQTIEVETVIHLNL